MYCGLQNNRPEDDKSIPENLFMSRKDPEQTPDKDLPADLFGRRKIFTVFSRSFRIFGNLFTVLQTAVYSGKSSLDLIAFIMHDT